MTPQETLQWIAALSSAQPDGLARFILLLGAFNRWQCQQIKEDTKSFFRKPYAQFETIISSLKGSLLAAIQTRFPFLFAENSSSSPQSLTDILESSIRESLLPYQEAPFEIEKGVDELIDSVQKKLLARSDIHLPENTLEAFKLLKEDARSAMNGMVNSDFSADYILQKIEEHLNPFRESISLKLLANIKYYLDLLHQSHSIKSDEKGALECGGTHLLSIILLYYLARKKTAAGGAPLLSLLANIKPPNRDDITLAVHAPEASLPKPPLSIEQQLEIIHEQIKLADNALIEQADEDGDNALHYVLILQELGVLDPRQAQSLLNILIEKGAKRTQCNKEGISAADFATLLYANDRNIHREYLSSILGENSSNKRGAAAHAAKHNDPIPRKSKKPSPEAAPPADKQISQFQLGKTILKPWIITALLAFSIIIVPHILPLLGIVGAAALASTGIVLTATLIGSAALAYALFIMKEKAAHISASTILAEAKAPTLSPSSFARIFSCLGIRSNSIQPDSPSGAKKESIVLDEDSALPYLTRTQQPDSASSPQAPAIPTRLTM